MKLFRGFGTLGLVILIQAIQVFATFSPLIRNPNSFLWQVKGDGAKNYFTYLAYLQQPFEQGLLKFEQFNYPYGEYLFYTDNTPLFALAVKLFSHYILDVTAHGLLIYHLFFISGIFISSGLVYLLLRQFIQNTFLIGFFSLVLPWIHPQIFRLEAGHYNLSFAFVLVGTILFLWRSYQKFNAGKAILPELFWFIPAVVICSFLHLYYLAIVLVFVGFFAVAWLIMAYRQKARYSVLLAWSTMVLVIPLSIVFSVVRLLDGYYQWREPGAGGYDAEMTKLLMKALFTPYFMPKLRLIVSPENPLAYAFTIESYAYLGSFAISAGAGVCMYLLIFSSLKTLKLPKDSSAVKTFFMLFGLAALGCLFIAPGDTIHFAPADAGLPNYFNVFRYAKEFSVTITHFRQLGRFSWIFFWFFNLWVIYLFDTYLFQLSHRKWVKAGAYILLILAIIDMVYVQVHYRKNLYPLDLAEAQTRNQLCLKPGLQSSHFQAVLPLPYYHVGSENYDYYFEVEDSFGLKTMQLSLRTHLPLMASKMSRSATYQVKALYKTVTGSEPPPELGQKLNYKPLLIAIDTTFYNGKPNFYTKENRAKALILFKAGQNFVEKHGLKYVGHYQGLQLYSWEIKK